MIDKLSNNEIEEIMNNEWIILSTSNNNEPRAIVVMPSRVESDRMILSNIQMSKTIDNLKKNPNCFINVYIKNNNDKQYKIECKCEIFEDGELFNEIKSYEEENNLPEELKVHSIIVAKYCNIEISEG